MANFDIYAAITDRIIAELENGIIPWHKPWTGTTTGAISRETGRPYSLLNQMLLGTPGEYLTWNQVKKEGGSVKKRKTTFNEHWEKLMLLGPPRFFYLRYGEKAVRDFLKVCIRGLKKLRFLELLIGRKGEAERHGKMIKLYQETLNDFAPYLSKLKGEGAQQGETV